MTTVPKSENATGLLEDLTFHAAQGMHTRAAFERRLVGSGRFTFVIALDGDDFHGLNHRYGMAAVDTKVRTAIEGATRQGSDLAVKWGGDEWAVVLTDCQTPADARIVAERIAASFRQNGIGVTWALRVVEAPFDHPAACAAIQAGLDEIMAMKAARDRRPSRRLRRALAALFPELDK